METVTVSRTIPAAPDEVRALVRDVGPFMRAAGFDGVEVDGDRVRIRNAVGFLEIELDLEVVEREGAALAYEQVEGIFQEMHTNYVVEGNADRSTVTATTAFALDVAFVGPLFDATVVRRQRRFELRNQMNYLESSLS